MAQENCLLGSQRNEFQQSEQVIYIGESKILIFWGLWSFYSHALYILSANDSGWFLQNPKEVAQIVGGQNAQSVRAERSEPQKD